jgi:hypothetical protein
MRIDEVVRVQNPMGGDFKSQLDRDRAAAAVRAQRQANREIPNRGPTSGAKSGTDPQGDMFTPGAVTTKSYNNALTKQFARPAGQGKGLDIMGNPLKQPITQKPTVSPVPNTPNKGIRPLNPAPVVTPAVEPTAPTTPNWMGQNTNIPAVQRKQQAQQLAQQTTQPTTQPAVEPTATAGTSAPAIAPTQTNTPSEPTQQPQTMPSEPVKIGGQKLDPNDPADAKMLQMIQKQLPQMPTPQVAAIKKVADKTLAKRKRNKPKKRF